MKDSQNNVVGSEDLCTSFSLTLFFKQTFGHFHKSSHFNYNNVIFLSFKRGARELTSLRNISRNFFCLAAVFLKCCCGISTQSSTQESSFNSALKE